MEFATLIARATLFADGGMVSIGDAVLGMLPDWPGPPAVAVGTDSCILVSVRHPVDGKIKIEVSNDEKEFSVHEGVQEYFHVELLTPNRSVHVFTSAALVSILNISVTGGRTLVRIWGNAERDADWIGVLATDLVPLPGKGG
jgi:hypothetical protein